MLRKTQIHFFPYCPELPKRPKQKNSCSKMWLEDAIEFSTYAGIMSFGQAIECWNWCWILNDFFCFYLLSAAEFCNLGHFQAGIYKLQLSPGTRNGIVSDFFWILAKFLKSCATNFSNESKTLPDRKYVFLNSDKKLKIFLCFVKNNSANFTVSHFLKGCMMYGLFLSWYEVILC